MKIALAILAAIILAAAIVADYKWRQWMTARKNEREQDPTRR